MSKKKKFAVVGLGLWGTLHARVLSESPEVELVAVCDIDCWRMDEIGNRFGVKRRFQDYRDLFYWKEIDAVSVATPDFAHREVVVAALEAGAHVLVEKPLDTTVEGCEAIRQAAASAGKWVMVDFHNRWNPAFVEAKRAIESGETGRLVSAHFRLSNTKYVPTRMLKWADRTNVLWFLGSHAIDLLNWLFDSRPRRVYAVERSGILSNLGVETPDLFHATVEFADGGVASLEHVWILPEGEPSMVDLKCSLVGEKGSIYIDTTHHRAVQCYTAASARYGDVIAAPEIHGQARGFAVESIRHFVECVVNNRRPLVGIEEGLAATRTICAILDSAASGMPVEIDWPDNAGVVGPSD